MSTIDQEGPTWAEMCLLSEAGWNGPDRSTVQQMSNGKRAANAGQRFYLMARKYKSKLFSNVSRIVECLLDSGKPRPWV